MKVCFINVSDRKKSENYKKRIVGPPQNIFSAAAVAIDTCGVEMVDENTEMKINFKTNADIIFIFISTEHALRGYEISREFKSNKKKVVICGQHASALPKEAKIYSDAVVVGEIEGVWNHLIADFNLGQLAGIYYYTMPFKLDLLNNYPLNIISKSNYNSFWSVLVSRENYDKDLLYDTTRIYENVSFRSIEKIIEEVKSCGAHWIELQSENLIVDREYAIKLFKSLTPLKIKWLSNAPINFVEDEELLSLASKSGLKYLLVDLDVSLFSDYDFKKKVKRYVNIYHNYGVVIDVNIKFGDDEHLIEIFDEALEFIEFTNLDIVHSELIVPLPGTKLYQKLEQENRIIYKNWSKFDGKHAVFKPLNMSSKQLEAEMISFEKKMNNVNAAYRYYQAWFK